MWVGGATGTEPEAQISRGPQTCEFNGRAAPSSQPFGLGPAPLQRDQGQPSRETLKTQTPTGSIHQHAHYTDTHTRGTDTTHATKTLPASSQSPSSESLPNSLVQAEGLG